MPASALYILDLKGKVRLVRGGKPKLWLCYITLHMVLVYNYICEVWVSLELNEHKLCW